jgi:hypothetical protein
MIDIAERLSRHRQIDPASGCWLWTGCLNNKGYGRVRFQGATHYVHRVALELDLGRPLAPSEWALHKCDVRNCFNPRDLYAGDLADNIADALARGRIARGARVTGCRLSPDEVREIRCKYQAGGVSESQLGNAYSVHQATIHLIVTGKNWRWVE